MKILFIESTFYSAYYFRRQLILELTEANNVTLVLDTDENHFFRNVPNLNVIELPSDLKSTNLFSNLKLKRDYKKIIREVSPDVVLTFTIKPNLYVPLAKPKKTFLVANITGLGKAFEKRGLLNVIVVALYRKAFKKCDYVFWQNEGIHKTLLECRIPITNGGLIPGSGVDVNYFPYTPMNRRPNNERVFLFSARLRKEKGVEEYLKVAEILKIKYPKLTFLLAGGMVDDYQQRIDQLVHNGVINYLGFVKDLGDLYRMADCVVLPSFYKEGVSNVLLESLSTGRPIITTNDIDGCKELLIEGKTGFGVHSRSVSDLVSSMEKIISVSFQQLEEMSRFSRAFVEKNYNRKNVVMKYIEVIDNRFK